VIGNRIFHLSTLITKFMSKNSRAKRDKRKKSRNKLRGTPFSSDLVGLDHNQVMKGLQKLFDPAKLTVPALVNADITSFYRSISEMR